MTTAFSGRERIFSLGILVEYSNFCNREVVMTVTFPLHSFFGSGSLGSPGWALPPPCFLFFVFPRPPAPSGAVGPPLTETSIRNRPVAGLVCVGR